MCEQFRKLHNGIQIMETAFIMQRNDRDHKEENQNSNVVMVITEIALKT